MTAPIFAGVLAAVVASVPPLVQGLGSDEYLRSPALVLGIACIAMVIQRFVIDRRSGPRAYDGLADLFIHIHSPASPDSSLRWVLRGFISLLLSVFGGAVGPEGAAIEWGHAWAIRSRSKMSRWYEQRRRSDASTALAAGISAAFGSPLAALLLPIELGMGGRYISVALSSLVAFTASKAIRMSIGFPGLDLLDVLDGLSLSHWSIWLISLLVGSSAGLLGAGIVRFFRYSQASLLDLFQTQAWIRILAGGVLLFLVILTYRPGHAPWSELLEQVILGQGKFTPEATWLLLTSGVLALAVVLAGFGTVGIFWPLLALGGFLGHGLATALHASSSASALAALAGGAGLWGAVLGAPIAGAVLAWEISGHAGVLLPCLLAASVAREVRSLLGVKTLVEMDLVARGMALIEGRSVNIMDAITVREALVSDHEVLHEKEPVSEIYPRLLKSRYPFLPIVNSQSAYLGLITVDSVQEAWQSQSGTSNSSLSRLLEAKDLLYRAGVEAPTIKVNDRLSATQGMFGVVPCVPVLTDDGRVAGLLFAHNVRIAYDREVARRSLTFQDRES